VERPHRPPSTRTTSPIDLGTAGALSLAGHALVAFGAVALIQLARFLHEPSVEPPLDVPAVASDHGAIEIDVPELRADSPLLAPLPHAEVARPVRYGGERVAYLDQRKAGRGGDGRVHEQALNLADQDDRISRDMSTLTSLTAAQLSRIRASNERRAYEDVRSGREPMELTFVAMGKTGVAEERRPEAASDPGPGARFAMPRSDLGAAPGGERHEGEGETAMVDGAATPGGPHRSPGVGFDAGRGETEHASLVNAHARPMMLQGSPSVPALDEGKPSDTLDSEQAVSARMQSLMHASTAGGRAGEGRGGEGGGGSPGAGGSRGPTSSATQLGAGGGGAGDLERITYLRAVQGKIHPLWANAFPTWAILEGRGGTAIVTFTIEANGTVGGATVTRSSGIPEFDANVRAAVLRGAPYGPLPAPLGPRLTWSMPFVAKNPAVRPKTPRDGATD
jgi:TonB family protein